MATEKHPSTNNLNMLRDATPVDFIDLTVDSPVRRPIRTSRTTGNISTNNSTMLPPVQRRINRQQHSEIQIILEMPTYNTNQNMQSAKNLIELDQTIILDDITFSDHKNINNGKSPDKNNVALKLTCPICLEELSSTQKALSTKCGHVFCTGCLKKALGRSKRCPNCRTTVTLESCIHLHLNYV